MASGSPFRTTAEKMAITGEDEDIYSFLPLLHQARHYEVDEARYNVCHKICIETKDFKVPFDERPNRLPLLREDVDELFNKVLPKVKGCWSVYWFPTKHRASGDEPYPDGFRSVFIYRTLEFMIRPFKNFEKERHQPPRLDIGWLDVCEALTQALVQNPGTSRNLTPVKGSGRTNMPTCDPIGMAFVPVVEIGFEWRLDRAPEDRIGWQVRDWKYDACGGSKNYHKMKEAYRKDQALQKYAEDVASRNDPSSTQPGRAFGVYVPGSQPVLLPDPKRKRSANKPKKRTSEDRKDSEQSSRSRKRRSKGSESVASLQDPPRSGGAAVPTTTAITQGISNLSVMGPGEMRPPAYGQGVAPPRTQFREMIPSLQTPPTTGPPPGPTQAGGYYAPHELFGEPFSYDQGGHGYPQQQQQQYEPGPPQDFGPYTASPEQEFTQEELEQMLFNPELFDDAMRDAIRQAEAEENKKGRHGSGRHPGPSQYKKGHDKHGRR